jgi:hypothetical protein
MGLRKKLRTKKGLIMKCWVLTDYSKDLQSTIDKKAKLDITSSLDILPEWFEIVSIFELAIEIDPYGNGKIWRAHNILAV